MSTEHKDDPALRSRVEAWSELAQPVEAGDVASKSDRSDIVPGYDDQGQSRLRNGAGNASFPPLTVREINMLHVMNRVTDKPGWTAKVHQNDIVARWRQEALQQANDFSDPMMDYCIAELRAKAIEFDTVPLLSVLDTNTTVIKSDGLVPTTVKDAFREAVKSLEQVPALQQDWHPGSDGKVLDLVHPSLFPFIFGTSRVLDCPSSARGDSFHHLGQGRIQPPPDPPKGSDGPNDVWSTRFQWLPSEIEVAPESEPKFTSYINNLHPEKHSNIYKAIESILPYAINMWDECLTQMGSPRGKRIRTDTIEHLFPQGEERPEELRHPSESEDDRYYADEEWLRNTRVLVRPEPGTYLPLPPPKPEDIVNLSKAYKDTGLQVIVKLANIHLTPEKPTYEGGSWHVEGMMNEHIVSTVLYYYDSANITESRLEFRRRLDDEEWIDVPYDQNDYGPVEELYGVEQEGPNIQELGGVVAREDRMLAFPNVLQHRVAPFRLQDPSKPGHRKILALFLIDPHARIFSTAHVPPQQRDWWFDKVRHDDSKIGNLPVEVQDMIKKSVDDFPISLDRAKELRLELMEERTKTVESVNDHWAEDIISFCEH